MHRDADVNDNGIDALKQLIGYWKIQLNISGASGYSSIVNRQLLCLILWKRCFWQKAYKYIFLPLSSFCHVQMSVCVRVLYIKRIFIYF